MAFGDILGKLGGVFGQGGMLAPGQLPPELAAMAEQQGGGPGGMMGLLQNPAFMAGMGMLQGNQSGQGIAGGLQGLQMANQQQIAQEGRLRDQSLRDALTEYFGLPGMDGATPSQQGASAPGPGAMAGKPVTEQVGPTREAAAAMAGAPNTDGNQYPPGGDLGNRDRLLALLLSQNNGSPFGGFNPFMLGPRQ